MSESETRIFFVNNNEFLVNIVKASHQFFINYGSKIIISPMSRITRAEKDTKNAVLRFYFAMGQEKGTNDCIEFPLNDNSFFNDLFDTYCGENNIKPKFSLNPFKFPKPIIASFEFSEYINQVIKNFKKSHKNETLIMELEKDVQVQQDLISNSGQDFTFIKGTFVPIKIYIPITKHNKTKITTEKKNKDTKLIHPLIEEMAKGMDGFKFG